MRLRIAKWFARMAVKLAPNDVRVFVRKPKRASEDAEWEHDADASKAAALMRRHVEQFR